MANHLFRLGVLARFFFFLTLAKYLLLFVAIPSALLAISGKVIDYGSLEPFFIAGGSAIAGGTISVYLIIVLMMFPAQLVSAISSRQYGLLPYIRHYLAALIACVLLFLQVVAYCILVFGLKSNDVMHYSLIVAVMLIVSVVVMLSFTKLGPFQFLYFFALTVLGLYLVPQLNLMTDLSLIVILVCLWPAFLSWWFGWHPKKYHKNLIGTSFSELNKQESFFWGGNYFFGAVPQNLESGILFGKFGSNFYQARMLIIGLFITGLIFVLLHMVFSYNFKNGLIPAVRVAIAIQIIQIGYNYSLAVFKNINKFWLYFSLEREQLFNFVERKAVVFYLKNLTAITFIISALSFFILDDYLLLKNIVLYVLASLLVATVTFYMVFIVYAKWRGNIKIFYWVNGLAMMFLLVSCGIGLEFFARKEITIYAAYLLTITLVCSSLILFMRQYAKRLWQHVDLVRVVV